MKSGSVLQVIASADRRGAETFALALGAALEQRDWTIRTIALQPGEHHDLEVEVLGRRPRGVATLKSLRRVAREHDLVVAHGSTTLSACAAALAFTDQRFVYRNIGDPDYWSLTRLSKFRTRTFLRRATKVVALSNTSERTLQQRFGVALGKSCVIPTGVSAAQNAPASTEERWAARGMLGLPREQRVAAVIGALSPEKGADLAVNAMASVAAVDTLLFAGDGPDRVALEELAHARAPGRVRFLGSLRDVSPVYQAADLIVLPSRTEGLPAVLIESGMRGIPVVATDVGYVRDIVLDSITGVIVRPDDPTALAVGIEEALALGDKGGAAAGAHCCEHFDLELVADRWDTLLRATT